MFAVKRNQVVVTALAVMIAVAGYLNFTESKSSGDIEKVDLNDPTSYEALLNDDGSISTVADDSDGLEFALAAEQRRRAVRCMMIWAPQYMSAPPPTHILCRPSWKGNRPEPARRIC